MADPAGAGAGGVPARMVGRQQRVSTQTALGAILVLTFGFCLKIN